MVCHWLSRSSVSEGFVFIDVSLLMAFDRNNIANRMRLYQHTAGCPVALEAFMDCNPMYRCFVPMNWYDAVTDNIEYRGHRRHRQHLLQFSIERAGRHHPNRRHGDDDEEEDEDEDEEEEEQREDPRVFNLFARVPEPSNGYDFSYRQREEQREFFRHFVTLDSPQSAYRTLNLYQYKIIAVCKFDFSIDLRSRTKCPLICF